jgi:hypothetical protein
VERKVIVKKFVTQGEPEATQARRQRRVQIIQEAGARTVTVDQQGDCVVSCECGPDQTNATWVCDENGDPCVCLCGCDAAEITEEKEDGHTVLKIRVPASRSESGDDPLVKAAGVSDAVENLGGAIGRLVRQARSQGSSWTEIGAALGISKQAAWERFSGEE